LDAKVFQKSMKSFGEIGQAHPHKVVWATTHAPIDEREMFVLVRDDLYRSMKINPNFNGMLMGPNYNMCACTQFSEQVYLLL
jgi:hypothetical protein